MRIAVEGCGHGTLHAIYASVEESCRVKGWDTVDLLIIGGDFQAVRNQYDLNVTAMPPKYRQMADFHEYYSGARVAPYLTIFIGGNHEASNHLFELYYGGWVAPNIYYLGAANVLQVGSLRIAGLSGIWKGYDYRKPHFERLPYNQDELTSIFHVRELDVRKLLSLRTQVDIGLSHDWPQGIEWCGDSDTLFKWKPDFERDALSGKLGNVAAKQCLDRLRPIYWFSAHLHCKYTAVLEHGEYEPVRHPNSNTIPVDRAKGQNTSNGKSKEDGFGDQTYKPSPKKENKQQVAAWQNFHAEAQKSDSEELQQLIDEQAANGSGVRTRPSPSYAYEETFKKVTTDEDLGRTVDSVKITKPDTTLPPSTVSQYDGCGFSSPLKRRRATTSSDDEHTALSEATMLNSYHDDSSLDVSQMPVNEVMKNPDEIDIDMSDDEDQETEPHSLTAPDTSIRTNGSKIVNKSAHVLQDSLQVSDMSKHQTLVSDEAAGKLNPQANGFRPEQQSTSTMPQLVELASTIPRPDRSIDNSRSVLNPDATFFQPDNGSGAIAQEVVAQEMLAPDANDIDQIQEQNAVSQEMRAELASLSKSFQEPEKIEISPPLPFPEGITNTTTNFLALDKCLHNRDFLQLLEIDSVTSPSKDITRPCKLQYDPEWLAILKVFASELELGGESRHQVPAHRGDTYYRDRILEEEKWVDENVVKPGLLQVPESFVLTAPVHDSALQIDSRDMPREYTNPQTSAFCKLIGIENPFDISEEDRDARVAKGPKVSTNNFRGRGRGGGRGRQGGGRGGFHGGRGQGRGRGRGRW